jgi:hypothetical protein
MYRLLCWTAQIFTASAILLAITIAATRKPMTALDMLQTYPDGSRCPNWCLFGTDPETMTDDQIIFALTRHPLLYGLYRESQPNSYDLFYGEHVDVLRAHAFVYIYLHEALHCLENTPECFAAPNNIYLNELSQEVALGTMITRLGAPDFIYLGTDNASNPTVSLCYRDLRLEFQFRTVLFGVVSPSDTLSLIGFYGAQYFDSYAVGSQELKWEGFKTYSIDDNLIIH